MDSSADRGEDLIIPAERGRNWLKDHARGLVSGAQQYPVLLGRHEEWRALSVW